MENKMSPAVKQNDERESAEVVAVARRRKFAASYKRRIVREADACSNPGAIGALLRREGLYSSHLSKWRQEIESIEVAALQSKPRGPKPDAVKSADRRVLGLEQENAKLRKQLGRAEQIIDVQKKLCELLGLPTAGDAL
ncbi:MAG: family transposase [Burkholderia sp.]|nr:family transposase [Burkholderia sp.]